MRNKFEALEMFRSWPEDWQRLCAEYWADCTIQNGVTSARMETRAVVIDESATMPSKPSKRKKVSSARRWHAKELEWLVYCTDQADTQAAGIRDFLKRYTDRNFSSCEQQLREIRLGNKTIYG